jgi:hypothetical protein
MYGAGFEVPARRGRAGAAATVIGPALVHGPSSAAAKWTSAVLEGGWQLAFVQFWGGCKPCPPGVVPSVHATNGLQLAGSAPSKIV